MGVGTPACQSQIEGGTDMKPTRGPTGSPAWVALLLAASQVASARAAEDPWETRTTGRFRMRVHRSVAADGPRVERWTESAFRRLDAEFHRHRPEDLAEKLQLSLYLYPAANDQVAPGRALLQTSWEGERLVARLHLLAPSVHPANARTAVDEPMDEVYFRRVLTHELATLYLPWLTDTGKSSGWRFFSAPAWFVQGYEEYLATQLSTTTARRRTYAEYRRRFLADPDRYRDGLTVERPYREGVILVGLLHEWFHRQTVQALLLHPAPTFWEAVQAVLGLDEAALARRTREWILATRERGHEDPLASLAWLEGEWRGDTWHARYSSPEGGMILSYAKEYDASGRVGFFETERIEVRDGQVVLVPAPFGSPSVPFALTSIDPVGRRARFENPAHDFPRSITYHRTGESSLAFRLEGVQGGRNVDSLTVLRRVP